MSRFIEMESISPGKYFETPLMKQYYAVKAKHPDAVLLFRVGDFYETFGRMPYGLPKYWALLLPEGQTEPLPMLNWQVSLTMLSIHIFPTW